MKLLLRAALRQGRAHPLSTLLMVTGIALGVAGVVAMDIARTSVSKSFDLSTAALVSRTSHQILGNDFSIPESLFTRVRTQWGIKQSAPVISAHVQLKAPNSPTLTLMGIDPFSEALFNNRFNAEILESENNENATLFFPRSKGILLAGGVLPGAIPGDLITLSLGKSEIQVPIAGFLPTEDSGTRTMFKGLILADIALAQELLSMEGRISRIDLSIPDHERHGLKALEQALPPGTFLIETRQRNQSVRHLSQSFEGSLSAFSMLALFMGIFLIYNTVSFSVARQRKRHGTLRALGATRGEIFRAVMVEIALFALVGSLLGLGLGIIMGKGAVQAVCATVSEMYYTLTVTQTRIAGFTLAKGLIAGIGAAFIAALFPALSAARTRPITLIQTSTPERRLNKIIPGLFLAGLLTLVFTALVFIQFKDRPGMDFLGIFMGFFGASLLVPALMRLGLQGLVSMIPAQTAFRGKSMLVKMAAGNISRALSRTGVLVASLMVVTSVYIGIDIMTQSFRSSVDQWVDGHIGGDIHVASADPRQPGLPPGLADQIRKLPHVRDLSDYTMLRLFSRTSGEVHLFSYVNDRAAKEWTWTASGPPGISPKSPLEQEMRHRLDRGEIWVSEIFARRNGVDTNSERPQAILETNQGPRAFPVAGIFRDYFMGGGRVVVGRNTLAAHWGEQPITAIQTFIAPNLPPAVLEATAQAVKKLLPRNRLFKVRLGREIKTEVLAAFDRTFMITTALQFLTALVALTGILNAVTALLMERSRELGILRACGAMPGQITGLVLMECSLTGFISGLLALPLGWALARVLIQVVNHRSFGWTYEMITPIPTLVQALTLATLAAGAAGIFPALRAAKTHIPKALHME